MKGRILVVDDDRDICRLVQLYLENEGYAVDLATTGEEALNLLGPGEASAGLPDAGAGSLYAMIILDVMLPGMDGFETARLARNLTNIPILLLSARGADVDKAVGLGVGADDYLTKPFSPVELVARVKAHLRRYAAYTVSTAYAASTAPAASAAPEVEAGPVRLDPLTRRVWVRGVEVALTAKEFDLLKLFVAHPGQVFTKAQLFDAVWGEEYIGADNTVMVHIRRLRAKIEADPDEPRLIKTIWGIGYRFEAGE